MSNAHRKYVGALPLREVQAIIGAWGEETFPDATPFTVMSHLRDEIGELIGEVLGSVGCDGSRESLEDEIADVAILTIQLAHRLGIDLAEVIARKHERNRSRSWEFDLAAGYSRHTCGT